MKILTLDVATKTGWAFFPTDKPESSIEHGSIKLDGKNAVEKTISMRKQLPILLRRYEPDFGAIEAPLSFIPQFKKTKKTLMGVEEETTTINANTIMQLNHLAGAAQMLLMAFNIKSVFVAPRSWQSVIPKTIQGDPKKRVSRFCEVLNISGGNMDSRDAAIIAVWAKGRCQELKMLERAA
ncbi:hypothetical protein [Hoeflea sp. TYP-13]|uniref:hypothetical protein n=1 Tax=Hoeflea sp. TYP-13 TaxID=3230023 RepID=UPI0034C619AD